MRTTENSEATRFDFLQGEWDAICRSADADGRWNEGIGSLRVSKVMDGGVSLEFFEGPYLGRRVKGLGLRAYNSTTSDWEHTWIDTSAPGGFLAWKGRFKGETISLYGDWRQPDGQHVLSRLTWFDITAQSARWVSHRSYDDGELWEKHWEIDFDRKPTAGTDRHAH